MLEMFTLTQTLAILLGLYMISAGVGLLTDSTGFAGMIEEFKASMTMTYLTAIMAFAIGGTFVAIHNLWATSLEIIISLIGWAALIEGVLMLAFRKPFFTLIGAIPLNAAVMKTYGIFVLVVGGVLIALALA